jgi:hypothetical protein
LLLSLAGRAQTTTVTSTTYGSGQNVTVNGPTNVGTSGTVTVSSGASVRFKATSTITLSPGFSSASGSTFRASIFVDADNDGMDDLWEATHGVSNPAADADGDGLSNLTEYLLGTTPTVAKQVDSGNSNALKIHRPNNP